MARKKRAKSQKEDGVDVVAMPEEELMDEKKEEDPEEEVEKEEPVVVKEEPVVVKKEEPVKKTAKDLEGCMTIEDAARRFVVNFKPSWLPSIKAFAEKQYRVSGSISESQCKSILKAWGAKII